MSLILVAEKESRYIERIRDALSSEGWRVHVVGGPREAIAAASAEPPQLVLVSSSLTGAKDLFTTFSKKSGGPGVLALVSEDGAGAETARQRADDLVNKPFTEQDLRLAVRRGMAPGSRAATPGVAVEGADGPRLTSQDIFGDLVAEVEGELSSAEKQPPAPAPTLASAASGTASHPGRRSTELDRALEETLSGLRRVEPRSRSRGKAPKRRPADDEVEALLSETLSGLDLSRGPRRRKPSARPGPAEERRQAGPPPAPPSPASPEAAPIAPERRAEIDFSRLEGSGALSDPPPAAPAGQASTPAVPPEPPISSAPPPPEPSAAEPAPAGPSAPAALAAEEAPEAAADGPRFGQYTLLERIAVGGMAEVWKARMTGVEGFQKTVAIKKILPHLTDNDDFVNMFIDEAKLAAQLSHPNIIHIYDLGKIGEHFYIAMEYVEGKNLRALLNESQRKASPIPRGLGLLIAARLASALDHAHRKKDFDGRELGLVHRDVSPQNVLLSNEGDIKLCDFGIVKAVSKASQTQMGALKGKLQYMSPEQAWGKPVDSRSDIFSLGSLLFEMLTGRRLFAGDSEISVLEAVRQCRVQAPRDLDPTIPEEVERVVLKALEQAPERRYQTAGQMQHDLEEFLYAIRPAPSQADLADYLVRLAETEEGEKVAEPQPAVPPAVKPAARPEPLSAEKLLKEAKSAQEPSRLAAAGAAAAATPAAADSEEEKLFLDADQVLALTAADDEELEIEEGGSRGKRLLVAVIVVLVLAGAAAGYLLWTRGTLQGLLGGPESPSALGDEISPPVPEAPPADLTAPDGEGAEEAAPGDAAIGESTAGHPSAAASTSSEPGSGTTAAAAPAPTEVEALAERELARREEALRQRLEQRERELKRRLAAANPSAIPASVEPPAAVANAPQTAPEAAAVAEAPAQGKPARRGPSAVEEPEPVEIASGAPTTPASERPASEVGIGSPRALPETPPQGAAPAGGETASEELRPEATSGSEAPRIATAPSSSPVKVAEPKPSPPAPPPPPPEPAVREGDLVGPGPDVVPPVLVSFDKPQYPPMARRLRVEGEVVLSILVDETGKVSEARITKGVRQAVGINEAAVEAARTSKFEPATKNGVRVKMWTTLRIPFKL